MRKVKLGDVAKVISGYAFKSSQFSEAGSIPVIKIKNIKIGRTDLTEVDYVSEDNLKINEKFHVESGDILISLTGSHLTQPNSVVGRVGLYQNGLPKALLNQRAGKIIPFSDEIDKSFLLYYLSSFESMREIAQMAHGAASQANVSPTQVESLEIPLPDIKAQKKIGEILSAYDNLIENNNRRIAILEEMAQSLYREWFVNFRFPGHENCKFVDSPLGKIPEGWEVKTIADLYDTSSGGTPSREKPEYYGNDYPWVKTKELKDGWIVNVEENISELGLKKSSAKIFPKDAVIMAMYGATIGQLGILSFEAATNQACCAIIPRDDLHCSWFIYLYLLANREAIIGKRLGAAQQNISQQIIKSLNILTPTPIILGLYNQIIEPLFRQIQLLYKQNINLKEQRDLLLPKLISGQIELTS